MNSLVVTTPDCIERPLGLGLPLCLAAGIVAGLAVARLEPIVSLALVGAAIVVCVVLARPLFGVALLLAATCFISFYEPLPGTSIDSIHVPDLLLVLLLGGQMLLIVTSRTLLIQTATTRLLLLHTAIGLAQLAASVTVYGRELFEALREFKYVLYYLLALVIVQVAQDDASLKRLIRWVFLAGAAVTLNAIVRSVVSPAQAGQSGYAAFYALEGLQGGSGTSIAYWCLCCTFCLQLAGKARIGHVTLLVMSLAYFVVMFHRHMYIAIGFAMTVGSVLLLWQRPMQSVRLILFGFVAIAMIGLLHAVGPPSLRRYLDLTVERALSLKGIEKAETVTLRHEENSRALGKIREHPLVGIGFATAYRGTLPGFETEAASAARNVHNSYLAVFLRLGLFGFVAFMSALVLAVFKGFTGWSEVPDPFLRAIALGNVLALTGLAISAAGSPYFTKDWRVAGVALMFGVQAALSRRASPPSVPAEGLPS
jgi:O-antigen ligase